MPATPHLKRPPIARGFAFGTKASTLSSIRPLLTDAVCLDQFHFTVREWRRDRSRIVGEVVLRFRGSRLAVRSSSLAEDGAENSHAGAFDSVLNVDGDDDAAVAEAVDRVVASFDDRDDNEVLIQPMIVQVAMSGVVMSSDMNDGAPYFVINYDDESGRTDAITGGSGVNKTVFVYHGVREREIYSTRIRTIVRMARNVAAICLDPVDMEFAVDAAGQATLLQVRRITSAKRWNEHVLDAIPGALAALEKTLRGPLFRSHPSLLGSKSVFGIMPDWNPAEIIGPVPTPLAYSLYRQLITKSSWRIAREQMGYRPLPGVELMHSFAGHPYIDVRASFNSFLPASLSQAAGRAIVDAYVGRLLAHPELHDKVEFDVAFTCRDFTTASLLPERYPLLRPAHQNALLRGLARLTVDALCLDRDGSLPVAERSALRLEAEQQRRPHVSHLTADADTIAHLLARAGTEGTVTFSVLARHAFIAEALLRSAVRRGALGEHRYQAFRKSIRTVTRTFSDHLASVRAGTLGQAAFLEKYGHLRPGTYDLMARRYDERPELLFDATGQPTEAPARERSFLLAACEAVSLEELLDETFGTGSVSVEQFLDYCRRAIAGREFAKLVFTRDLSDALSLVHRWGESRGLSAEEVSCLSIDEVLAEDTDAYAAVSRGRFAHALARAVKLPPLIASRRDLHVVAQLRTQPNFITTQGVSGMTILLGKDATGTEDIAGRIVCIENADPGFDWLFTKNIAALVTKYGGTNSHMAIRCMEFGLPAAIGCGDQVFDRIVRAGGAQINCGMRTIKPAHTAV